MLDSVDREILRVTQSGLPLVPAPYGKIARTIGVDERDVLARLERLLSRGAIRRIGVIPNHYALGLTANGMSVWDVRDDCVAEAGAEIAALDFVTHCYERPRHLPMWPYNLFAMVHGAARAEVEVKVARIAELLGSRVRQHDVLFSTRILKKTGLRLAA